MASIERRAIYSMGLRRIIASPLVYSLLGLWILLVVMETVRPCFFLHDDNATWFIGAYVHDFRVLTETGRLAEINYFQHAGEPFLEQGQTAVLYPPVYLGVALAKWVTGDGRWSIEWVAAVHLTIGLLGFYFWARQNGVTRWMAALGGLAWVLNPFVLIVSAGWIMVSFVAAWLPWLFGALDRLWQRPSPVSALLLGLIAALLFLQGYVQWTVYAFCFLGVYMLLVFLLQAKARRLAVIYYLTISTLFFLVLILPLLLPMWHATEDSVDRAQPFSAGTILFFSLEARGIFLAQLLSFTCCAFGASTAILFSPALILSPLILFLLFWERPETRRRLFPLLLLALLAIVFSTTWYEYLTAVPLLNRLRWPFKIFVFAHFFLIAALVVGLSAWATARAKTWWKPRWLALTCLVLVVGAELGVALSRHDHDLLSPWLLPAGPSPLLPGMDLTKGREVSFGNEISESMNSTYLTHLYATYFGFPSLGGYNPLVGQELNSYALYLDYPNFCTGKLTPDFQKNFEARAVRYWFVDPHSPQYAQAMSLPGLQVLEASPQRVVFEDTQASPVVYAASSPTVPCAMTYSGNSMLVHLDHVHSPVEVAVGPLDGWWYRVDRGPWYKPVYEDEHLKVNVQPTDQLLEISYFDPRFWLGLRLSGCLLLFLVALLVGEHFYGKRKTS